MSEPPSVEWNDNSAVTLALMQIEAKLDELLRYLEEDDGEEEEEPDA